MDVLGMILVCLWLFSPYIVGGLLTVFAACSIPIFIHFRKAPIYTKIALIAGDLIYILSMLLAVMALFFDIHIYLGIGMTKDILFFTFLIAGILLISGEGLFLKKRSAFRSSTSTRLIVWSSILLIVFSWFYTVSYDFTSPEYTFYSSSDGEHEVFVRKERDPISFGPFGAVGYSYYYFEKYETCIYHAIDYSSEAYRIEGTTDEFEVWYNDQYCYTVTKD